MVLYLICLSKRKARKHENNPILQKRIGKKLGIKYKIRTELCMTKTDNNKIVIRTELCMKKTYNHKIVIHTELYMTKKL